MSNTFLLRELEKNGIKYIRDHSLKDACTFKIGGICAIALFPENTEQLAECISLLDRAEVELFVAGKCSNTLFSDSHIDKAIVFTCGVDSVKIQGTRVSAECGTSLVTLCRILAKEGLGGMEFASGIPGSIGGAVYMNAGAYGGTVGDIVSSTLAYNREDGKTYTLTEHGFGYRESIYHSDRRLICLSAELSLTYAPSEQISARIRELTASRREKQPIEYPSAGSYFKRPAGDFAGRLIEVCGLKGAQIGGARVSEKHAGFIVNVGGASFDDVMRLEELVRERVYSETGVTLCREVEIVE